MDWTKKGDTCFHGAGIIVPGLHVHSLNVLSIEIMITTGTATKLEDVHDFMMLHQMLHIITKRRKSRAYNAIQFNSARSELVNQKAQKTIFDSISGCARAYRSEWAERHFSVWKRTKALVLLWLPLPHQKVPQNWCICCRMIWSWRTLRVFFAERWNRDI